MQLRRASADDAAAVHGLLVQCGLALSRSGFHNWNPPAPLSRIERDIEEREVFVVVAGSELIATVTAALQPTIPFAAGQWQDTSAKALYVNRLAVAPQLQQTGIGRWLTIEMERRALELECRAVRLDALAANSKLVGFYERAGYEVRFYREHSGWRFACMEKLIATREAMD